MRTTNATLLLFLILSVNSVSGQRPPAGLSDANLRARAGKYEPMIAAAAARQHVDPHLLWTIAYLESRFRQSAISYKNGRPCAYGMMQFTPPTAARFGLKDPRDASAAIDAAARYVSELQKRFGLRGDLILAAYNAGEGTVESYRDGKRLVLGNGRIINPGSIRTGGVPPYSETRHYVAQGRIIHQTVSREGLFRTRPSERTSALKEVASIVVVSPLAGSIYLAEPDPNLSQAKPVKDKTASTPGSFYVE
jgi:soluble lytic murein transglycosylase-like protein